MTEDELIEEICSYRGTLYIRALGWTKCSEDAEDVVQDTLIRAIARVGTDFTPNKQGGGLLSWVSRVCYTRAMNLAKKRKKERRDKARLKKVSIEQSVQVPYYETESVQAAVARLNQDHKDVVILKLYKGYTYKEIGEELGIPAGTAMSRLSRALDVLCMDEVMLIAGKEIS